MKGKGSEGESIMQNVNEVMKMRQKHAGAERKNNEENLIVEQGGKTQA